VFIFGYRFVVYQINIHIILISWDEGEFRLIASIIGSALFRLSENCSWFVVLCYYFFGYRFYLFTFCGSAALFE